MAETLIKICGLHSVEVLKSMQRIPLDYVGFVFAESRRKVTPQQAAEMIAELANWETGKTPGAAGVFVNPAAAELRELLQVAPLDVIQLHGGESPEFCRELKRSFPGVQVWKALSVSGSGEPAAEAVAGFAGAVDALLLDTYDPKGSGGSGKTFDWSIIPAYRQAAARYGLPLFIAGGLHADNVGELLEQYAPDGVDVSSGVETGGIKDTAKMTAFVERVKQS
ncbi:phosphoribosylanthranilate isomerase ['Paenibacillus yunnanensis' Narsing Rao et al. 2020]|uniref:phosphoribosylanthranilate isomerase n=1 Tax=Paenibacillus tengchongensis TaxID=2608684 RepID=UPI00124C81D7|nr:phosphoribosylanthranilate isomerase [Paenibacillus tengchongensis]